MGKKIKVLLGFWAIFAISLALAFACDGGGDSEGTGGKEGEETGDDDDVTDDEDDGRVVSAGEEECRKNIDNKIESGVKFYPGVYHVLANVYSTNIMVYQTLGGPMVMNLWVRIGIAKKDNPSAFCTTKEDWGEDGENCCMRGEPNCVASALLCMIELPDDPPNGLDKPYPKVSADGTFKAKITDIYIPKEINPNLSEDALGNIDMEVTLTSDKCIAVKVDILLTEVKMGSAVFNAVTMRNYDIKSWPSQRINNPENDIAVGWWERFHMGAEPELEDPFDVKFALEHPEEVTKEPVCLDPRQEIIREGYND